MVCRGGVGQGGTYRSHTVYVAKLKKGLYALAARDLQSLLTVNESRTVFGRAQRAQKGSLNRADSS